jgi:hypothetical protein
MQGLETGGFLRFILLKNGDLGFFNTAAEAVQSLLSLCSLPPSPHCCHLFFGSLWTNMVRVDLCICVRNIAIKKKCLYLQRCSV